MDRINGHPTFAGTTKTPSAKENRYQWHGITKAEFAKRLEIERAHAGIGEVIVKADTNVALHVAKLRDVLEGAEQTKEQRLEAMRARDHDDAVPGDSDSVALLDGWQVGEETINAIQDAGIRTIGQLRHEFRRGGINEVFGLGKYRAGRLRMALRAIDRAKARKES